MGNEIQGSGQRPTLQTTEVSAEPITTPHSSESALENIRHSFRENPDSFTHRTLNRVMNSLRSLVTLRPDRMRQMEVRREEGHAGGRHHSHRHGLNTSERLMVLRQGRLVSMTPDEVRGLVARGEMTPAQAQELGVPVGSEVQTPTTAPVLEVPPAQELTSLERVFLGRFGGGAELGTPLPSGEFSFLQKPQKAWGEFFQKFLPFTFSRNVSLKEVKALIFRGLVMPGDALATQTSGPALISDLQFQNGRTDKFARVSLSSPQVFQEVLETLASAEPGLRFTPDGIFPKNMESLSTLSVSYKVVNTEALKGESNDVALAYRSPQEVKSDAIRDGVNKSTRGVAFSARTEQEIAQNHDLSFRALGVPEVASSTSNPVVSALNPLAIQKQILESKKEHRKKRSWLLKLLLGEWGNPSIASESHFSKHTQEKVIIKNLLKLSAPVIILLIILFLSVKFFL